MLNLKYFKTESCKDEKSNICNNKCHIFLQIQIYINHLIFSGIPISMTHLSCTRNTVSYRIASTNLTWLDNFYHHKLKSTKECNVLKYRKLFCSNVFFLSLKIFYNNTLKHRKKSCNI